MQKSKPTSISIFTDGSSRGNPGPGGFGIIIIFHDEDVVHEYGGREADTTNNRMELQAVIGGLKMVGGNKGKIALHIDSTYVIDGITKWVYGWEQNESRFF